MPQFIAGDEQNCSLLAQIQCHSPENDSRWGIA
jgi:hypothetical protein